MFIIYLMKGVANVFVPLSIGFIINNLVEIQSWRNLIICLGITSLTALTIDSFIILNQHQRNIIFRKLHLIK